MGRPASGGKYIPEEFIELCRLERLPDDLSMQFYGIITSRPRVSYESLVGELFIRGVVRTLKDGRRLLSRIQKQWVGLQSRQIVETGSGDVVRLDISRKDRRKLKAVDTSTYLEYAARELEKVIGKFTFPSPPKMKSSGRASNSVEKVVICGDLHVPFHDERMLGILVGDSPATLWINGDLLDMYSVSKYRKEADSVKLQEELAIGRGLLELLSKKFYKVHLVTGNHEERAFNRVREFFPQILPLVLHPFRVLTFGLENVEVVDVEIPGTAAAVPGVPNLSYGFAHMCGDALISHFNMFAKTVSTAETVFRRFSAWWPVFSKNTSVFKSFPKVIVQGHSHRLGVVYKPDGTVLVDGGCLCKPMAYMFEQMDKYDPPTMGYVVLNQEKGITRGLEVVFGSGRRGFRSRILL